MCCSLQFSDINNFKLLNWRGLNEYENIFEFSDFGVNKIINTGKEKFGLKVKI